jgi:hypothetical protein
MLLAAGCILRAWEVAKGSSVHRLGLFKPGTWRFPATSDGTSNLFNVRRIRPTPPPSQPPRVILLASLLERTAVSRHQTRMGLLICYLDAQLPYQDEVKSAWQLTQLAQPCQHECSLFKIHVSFSKEYLSRRNLFLEGISCPSKLSGLLGSFSADLIIWYPPHRPSMPSFDSPGR